jgi:hypothetical protein
MKVNDDGELVLEASDLAAIGMTVGEHPPCAWCGAKAPPDTIVAIMVAGPDGPLCMTCAEHKEETERKARDQ